MRSNHAGPAPSTKLLAIAALGIASLAAGCTPNLNDTLACVNSTQCPTGYFCAADGKCQQGATVPEITVLTQTAGVTFSGVITLEMSVIDPAGITSVTVGLAGPGADAGSPIAATPGQGSNIYTATLDTRALGIATSGTFTATITATNANGKTSTATVQLTVNDEAPPIGAIAITPASVSAGQAATITFTIGEALAALPVVKLTPPDGSAPRHAAYVSLTGNAYTYQFVPLSTDPLGAWTVQITASDSLGNSASSSGADSFTVTQGGTQTVTFTALRSDGIADARAYDLKSGATTAITATFGAALSANPSGFLCPVGAPGPCTASSAGATTLTSTAGTAANSYVFQIPAITAITGNPGAAGEGTHVFTVSGSASAGAISGSVNVIYDFTAPSLTVQQVDGTENYDSAGRLLASKARYPNGINYLLILNETLPEPPVVTVDGVANAELQPAAHPDSALLPEYTLMLDGMLASGTPVSAIDGHYVGATVCDAANNCNTQKSGLFVEVDTNANFAFTYPNEEDPPLSDGGVDVHKAGDTVTVGVDLDRTLGNSGEVVMSVQLVNAATGDTITFPNQPLLDPTQGPTATPFVYDYATRVPTTAPDGTYAIEVTSGVDGYGNNLLAGTTPFVQTTGPFVTIKTSIPELFEYNADGDTSAPSQAALTVGLANTPITFVAESNGVAGAYEDLFNGTITVCVNPNTAGAALVCPSGSGASNNGLIINIKPPSGTSPGANPISNFLGEVDLSASANTVSGPQLVVINYTDAAGNLGALPINIEVSTQAPTLAGYQFNNTVLGVNQTATALVSLNGVGYVTGGNAGSLTGVAVSVTPTSSQSAYSVAFKMPASCNGGVNPNDGVPFPVYVTLGNASGSNTSQIGTLTCAATSIANATVLSNQVSLVKQPFADGTVRSVVSAAPGTITGIVTTGTGAGVTLIAQQGSAIVGSGVVNADGSVAEFQVAGGLTQVALHFADLLGNTKPVAAPGTDAGYPEQLLINGTGGGVANTANPFQLVDVSTGDDTFFAAPYWVDGGPGVDGGIAGPVKASLLADGGGTQTAGNAQTLLATIDNQFLTVSSSKAFDSDAGTYRPTPIGAEPFGNPLISIFDGGFVAQVSPPARFGAAMGAINNTVYMYGGSTPNGANSVAADPQQGTIWEWQRDTGWTKDVVTVFDGGAPIVPGTNQSGGLALGFDSTGDPLLIGGGSGIVGLYTNYLADGGVSQYWGDAGSIGTPTGNGGVSPASVYVTSSASGYGYYSYIDPYGTSSDGGPIYEVGGTQMTVLNPLQSPINNCLIVMSGCGPTAEYYCPAGTLDTFGCYSSNSGGGLAGSQHGYAALAVATASLPDGGSYGVFSFGGKYSASGYASNDFYGGSLLLADGGITVTWVPLTSSNGVVPPARSQASLTYEQPTNRVNLYGGADVNGNPLSDNWEYDLATSTWTQIDNTHAGAIVPPARLETATASLNGNLYLFGGQPAGVGGVLGDGWTLGREARNRFIAKVPIASQLTSPTTASVTSLTITIANPGYARFQGDLRLEGHSPELVTPDTTIADNYYTPDLYLWNGSNWQLIEDTGLYVQTITLPASVLPSIIAGDGNLYVMAASEGFAYANETPPAIVLDALDFTLNFQ